MKESRISKSTGFLMVSTAVFFDVLQAIFGLLHFIPVVGNALAVALDWAINLIALLTFSVWFNVRGATFFKIKGKGSKSRIAAMVSELLPFVPGWTISVALGVKMVQSEDRGGVRSVVSKNRI